MTWRRGKPGRADCGIPGGCHRPGKGGQHGLSHRSGPVSTTTRADSPTHGGTVAHQRRNASNVTRSRYGRRRPPAYHECGIRW
ncbi:hypothetical protein AB0J84_32255, partial [Micromonospora arborensis]|uniref:hypothetical protein n=1 Tax=Micromonospora arborensis TaxID=2116518 RepID=UPI00342779B6